MNRRLRRVIAAAVLATACTPADPAPQAPSVTGLRAAYAPADGTLTPANAPFVAKTVVSRLRQVLQGRSLLTELLDVIGELKSTSDTSAEGALSVTQQGLTTSGSGWLRLTHICEGFSGHDPPDAKKNGRIQIWATFSKGAGVGSVVWGNFDGCRLPSGAEAEQVVDGDVALDLKDASETGVLAQFDLTWLDTAGAEVPLQLDFRLAGESVANSIALPEGGHVLVGVVTEDGAQLAVDDMGGRWNCAVDTTGEHGGCDRGTGSVSW